MKSYAPGVGRWTDRRSRIDTVTPTVAPYAAFETAVTEAAQDCPRIRRLWATLAGSRDTTAAAYQSPEFFEFLRDSEQNSTFEVLTVRETRHDEVVGIVPVKVSAFPLAFTVGARTLLRLPMRALSILGGDLMVPKCLEALDSVFTALSARYSRCGVFYLPEISSDSDLWRYLQKSQTIRRLFDVYVLDGFRPCHSIPIPWTVEEYQRKLSKKRRYNLLRQERILRKYSGDKLELIAADNPERLDDLFSAIDILSTPYNRENISDRKQYALSARRGFLKCFILHSDSIPIALVIGTKAGRVYRVHQFLHDSTLAKYSPGVTLWQMVLRHLIATKEFKIVDMGYGAPAFPHRSTNVIEYKGRILLFRRSLANRCRMLAHRGYSGAVEFLKRRIPRAA